FERERRLQPLLSRHVVHLPRRFAVHPPLLHRTLHQLDPPPQLRLPGIGDQRPLQQALRPLGPPPPVPRPLLPVPRQRVQCRLGPRAPLFGHASLRAILAVFRMGRSAIRVPCRGFQEGDRSRAATPWMRPAKILSHAEAQCRGDEFRWESGAGEWDRAGWGALPRVRVFVPGVPDDAGGYPRRDRGTPDRTPTPLLRELCGARVARATRKGRRPPLY